MLTADGFDSAIIGVIRCKGRPDVVCYDYEKCVEILISDGSLDRAAAIDYLEFNVTDAYLGEGTPAFLVKGGRDVVEGWDS